jgi:F-type H+-transporting ATPase subunit b
MSKHIRIFFLAAALLLPSGLLCAQPGSASQPVPAASAAEPASVNQAPDADSSKASGQAETAKPEQGEEEYSQFKYTSVVKSLASKTGLSKAAVYWIFVIINFVILAAALAWVVRKVLPNGFAPRTAEIQKALEEARKASADASARLGEIEGRLARLDAEIAGIRSAAEADFTVEEQRIKAAAEQDAKNVIAAAEQEIAAAARTAQRELKSFVADLAVNLAENKIKVDDQTDQALIRSFAAELGKDGQ